MKKTLKIIISTLFLALIAFVGYKVIVKIKHKKEVAEHIKTIPEFSYSTIDNKIFTDKDLKENTPTLFLYFNSECEHCQNEAGQIRDNTRKFATTQLIFISFEDPKKITAFANKYKLTDYDNITFLLDKHINFSTTFDVKSIPTIIIYDANKKLIEKIKGEIKTDYILKKLKKQK